VHHLIKDRLAVNEKIESKVFLKLVVARRNLKMRG
jgi:hypothetical protein